MFGLDARGQIAQLLPVQRRAGELADLGLQSWLRRLSSSPETIADVIRVPSGGSVSWAAAAIIGSASSGRSTRRILMRHRKSNNRAIG